MAVETHECHFIGGKWVKSTDEGKYLDVVDASNGQVFARIPAGSSEDANKAVKAAREAFPKWSQAPLSKRKEALKRIVEKWQAKKAKAVEVLQKELGCTAKFAEKVQVPFVDMHFNTTLDCVEDVQFEERTRKGAYVVKEPIGVVGCMTPWNYPYNQIANKIAPALLVGCTVILKPSKGTPLCAILLAEAIDEAGLPPGVFNLLLGSSSTIGEALAAHPEVDMVSFTGSTNAGRRITELSAGNLKAVRTELGGKGAALLLDDANMKEMIPEFMGTLMQNTGQSCNALSRLLVPEAKYAEAVEIAKQVAESTKVGHPSDPNADIGPLQSQKQWDKVQHLIQKGMEEGAKLVTGGPGKPEGFEEGFYVKPTVFSDVRNNMTIAREEIFGPVLSIIPYSTEQEGIEIANDTIYGLMNAVASADSERGLAVARKLRSGMVLINNGDIMSIPDAPFGGYKQSGNAREWGKAGIEEYLVTKHLAARWAGKGGA